MREIIENIPAEELFSNKEILDKSPKELVDFFCELEDKNELEAFLDKALEDDQLVAQFSYWEKWLEKKLILRLQKQFKMM